MLKNFIFKCYAAKEDREALAELLNSYNDINARQWTVDLLIHLNASVNTKPVSLHTLILNASIG